MAVHGTILARQRHRGANAVCNGTNWNRTNHNSTIRNSAVYNNTTRNSAIYNSAIRVNTNATRVIPPPPAFSWRPLRYRCRCNLD